MTRKHLTYMKTTVAVAAVSLALASAAGCGRKQEAENVSDSTDIPSYVSDRPDGTLKAVSQSVAKADAKSFASMCDYPIIREYPLRDIPDSAKMVEYFPIMFDDSIRIAMDTMEPEHWENYGWRGWSPRENNEMWVDDKVYAVNYYSKAEIALRNVLAREEIESLAPELQNGWVPSFCLRDTANSVLYRVDFRSSEEPKYNDESDPRPENGEYRMSVYPKGSDLHRIPSIVLNGTMVSEGSAGIRIFTFTDSIGTKAVYSPDSENPEVVFSRGDSIDVHPVTRAYWRDYLHLP